MKSSPLILFFVLIFHTVSSQTSLHIPGEILSSAVSADREQLALSTPDSVYLIRMKDLVIEKKWAHRIETPVILGFHPTNRNILLMQAQKISASSYSGGLVNYGLSWQSILDNYRKFDRKYNELPADSIFMWDLSQLSIVNKTAGNFYFQFGNAHDRLIGISNKVFPYEYEGKMRFGTRGADLISREKDFEKRSETTKSCRQLLISPAQDRFVASWRDGYIHDTLWFSVSVQDFKTHQPLFQLDRIADLPSGLCLSADGRFLAVAAKWKENERTRVRIFSLESNDKGIPRGQISEIPDLDGAADLQFSPDARELFFRNERNDWFAWDIAGSRFSQKIWSNLTSLSQIHATIYSDNHLWMIGARWPLSAGIPKESDKTYAVEKISLGDLAVISKTDEEKTLSYADSSSYTMLLNDVPVNNTDALLRFSSNKTVFTSVEETMLQVWNARKRKKILQMGFDREIKAFPDRQGQNILVIEKKIQQHYSEYILHLVNPAKSTRSTSSTLEPGESKMDGSSLYCDCIPDPVEDNSWYCADGSSTIWKISGTGFQMKPVGKTNGTSLKKLVITPQENIYAMGENESRKMDTWFMEKNASPQKIIASGSLLHMTIVNEHVWMWNNSYTDSTIDVWKKSTFSHTLRFPGKIERVDAGPGMKDAIVQYQVNSNVQLQRFVEGKPKAPQATDLILARFYMLSEDELLAEENGFTSYLENATVAIPWTVNSPQVLSSTNFDVSGSGRYILFDNLVIDLKETEQWEISSWADAALLQDSSRLNWLQIYRRISYGNETGGFTLVKLKAGTRDTVKSKTWINLPGKDDDFYFTHDKISVSPDKKWALTYVDHSSLNKGKLKAPPMIWNLETMTGQSLSGIPEMISAAFSPDSKKLRFYEVEFNERDFSQQNKVYEYNIGTRKLTIYSDINGGRLPFDGKDKIIVDRSSVGYFKAEGDSLKKGKTYLSREDLTSAVYSEATGKIIAATRSGSLLIWEKNGSASPVAHLPVHSSKIEQLELRGNRLYSLSSNGEIGITNIHVNAVIAVVKTMMIDKEIRIAMYTPGNYYRVDPDLMRYLHFVRKGEVFPLTSFDLQGNRPDKVYAAIGLADSNYIATLRQSWIHRVQRAGFDPSRINEPARRPSVEWDREGLPVRTTDPQVKLRFVVMDEDAKLKRLHIRVNGVPVASRQGFPLQKGLKSQSMEQMVMLHQGMNTISISATNENGWDSYEETMEIRYDPIRVGRKRLLYAGIGVSAYSDTTWNLRYAAKDVEDLAATLRYYADSTQLIRLVNKQATKEAILALKEQLKKTSVDDVVILSFAGHGISTTEKGFLFAPHDMDFSKPEAKGLSMEMIEDLLDEIPARRRLLLLDACHSGEDWMADSSAKLPEGVSAYSGRGGIVTSKKSSSAMSRNSYFLMKELFSDFTKGNGAFMISAAGSHEYAFEGIKGEENGVFTRSFLRSLYELGKKGSSFSSDQPVRIRDLRKLIYQKVTVLTNGLQNPTSRQENGWWNWSF